MKKIFMIICAMLMAITMNAQTQTNYTGYTKTFDNVWVGVTGGVQTNAHDFNTPQGAIVGLQVNKDITPVWGFTLEANVGFNNTANWLHPEQTHVHNGLIVDNVSAFVDTRVNFSNLFCGYKGQRRFFELEGVAGVGYGHGFYKTADANGVIVDEHNNDILVKAGLNAYFNVSDAVGIVLRPAIIYGVTGNEHGYGIDCRNAVGQVELGLVYRFKTSNTVRHMEKAVLYDAAEVARLNARIAELEARKPAVVEKVVEKVVTVDAADATYAVTFAQNKAELTDAAKAILDKVPTDATVDVAGSTSPEGTVTRNTKLAVERAQAVADYLKARGVKVNKVVGGEAGRAAVVTVK